MDEIIADYNAINGVTIQKDCAAFEKPQVKKPKTNYHSFENHTKN